MGSQAKKNRANVYFLGGAASFIVMLRRTPQFEGHSLFKHD